MLIMTFLIPHRVQVRRLWGVVATCGPKLGETTIGNSNRNCHLELPIGNCQWEIPIGIANGNLNFGISKKLGGGPFGCTLRCHPNLVSGIHFGPFLKIWVGDPLGVPVDATQIWPPEFGPQDLDHRIWTTEFGLRSVGRSVGRSKFHPIDKVSCDHRSQ